jgi:hypothetical protein
MTTTLAFPAPTAGLVLKAVADAAASPAAPASVPNRRLVNVLVIVFTPRLAVD